MLNESIQPRPLRLRALAFYSAYVIYASRKLFTFLLSKKITMRSENDLATIIIQEAFDLHKILGPGLLEKVYEECFFEVLKPKVEIIERQKQIPIMFKGKRLPAAFRCDLIIDKKVIIELKAVEFLHDLHFTTLLTYLRLTNLKLGLLLNFNTELMKDGIRRVVNGL
jgi:GxxExxY protein